MKSAVKAVALFVLLGAALAPAQPQPGQFQHVIVVVQENRTPDNLFGGVPPQNGWNGSQWFEKGVDLAIAPQASQDKGGQSGQPWCLGACFDPGHENAAWQNQFTDGLPRQTKNPGGCVAANGGATTCNRQPVCSYWDGTWAGCSQQNPITLPAWPEESYVGYNLDQDSQGNSVLAPYVSVATQYGFANYFYQTNQGPSQPAHDFLFGGTSAPYGLTSQQYYNWFAADNPKGPQASPTGCMAAGSQQSLQSYVPTLGPDGASTVNLYPCFDHKTLVDLLEGATPKLKWKYYTNGVGGIWVAPNGITDICGTRVQQPDGSYQCTGSDFTQNVITPDTSFLLDDFHGGGTNINAPPPPGGGGPVYCNLPNVAWIIPDGTYSDHAGFKNGSQTDSTDIEGGPNWVASIVNAVGNATCVEPPNSPFHGQSPWNDTVIFVVWDDWGGWYDHVGAPYEPNDPQFDLPCYPQYQPPSGPFWGCGYTYGFRVPFLVVSAYTQAGTVSGGCGPGEAVSCGPNSNTYPHQHDFGSILAFIEYNFGLQLGGINLANGYPFADYYAPELVAPGGPYVPLADFFNVNPQTPMGFRPITTDNNSFTFDYFYNFNGPFTDPDNDVIDND